MDIFDEMKYLFERANERFLKADAQLFYDEVSERTLCGALMLHLYDVAKGIRGLGDYHVDVEYNKNGRNRKTIYDPSRAPGERVVPVQCDLILHSRGRVIDQDNLIAVEMKKSYRPKVDRDKDRERLMALTRITYDGAPEEDVGLPQNVCRYALGVYYEINYRRRRVFIEYYKSGTRLNRTRCLTILSMMLI